MKAGEIINYKSLSLLLAGNATSIRKNKTPKKYKKQVQELETLIAFFISKNSENENR